MWGKNDLAKCIKRSLDDFKIFEADGKKKT